MLQYPLQLPPLSLSSSKRVPTRAGDDSTPGHIRNGHSALTHKRVTNDKLVAPRQSNSYAIPLSISAALSASSSPSSSPDASPYLSHKQIPRSPLVLSHRQPSTPVSRSPHTLTSNLPSIRDDSSRHSSFSSVVTDILSQGDLVGDGLSLQGETICRVPISSSEPRVDYDEPAKEFEVVRKLGTGSYAVVYLVREVLSRPLPSDDGHYAVGRLELDEGPARRPSVEYGREYAIKLLSKANLDKEALDAQMFEATIHQSLPAHPNIVTLHRTLETPSFLLLLLEFVPGEDLFYFLEQSRDHYQSDPSLPELSTSSSDSSSCSSRTPPTPSLLSSLNPGQLLSRTRLRLIASMFSQMCEAVAVCHENYVFHRDIKPENFIVTDGWTTLSDGRCERKVIVKLTDFGLSTTDTDSADMDCGSAPYMSFECRNNIHPTYSPRAADVWSLGIVLINMLYHYNPWTDTTQGVCPSFELFRRQPVEFFMNRFTGMTSPVAEFLATNVFCILDSHQSDSQRISARAFGTWIKDLPSLLGSPAPRGHSRTASVSSTQGYCLASIPHSRRPSLRNAPPRLEVPASQRASKSLSRAPSLGPAFEALESLSTLATVLDQDTEEQEQDGEVEPESRSASTHKRRKRGARKGKGLVLSPVSPIPDRTLDTLAEASQALAREISRTSRSSQVPLAETPVSVPAVPPVPPVLASPLPPTPTTPTISKKPSKWKLSFGKGSSASVTAAASAKATFAEEPVPDSGKAMSATASNVTSLLMSLNAPAGPVPVPEVEEPESWGVRGRRAKNSPYGAHASPNASSSHTWGPSSSSPFGSNAQLGERRAQNADARSQRAISPASTRSGRPLASSASSMASSNWRSSMSSVGTSSSSASAFTRYSNGSTRSVSTAATSVSSNSWRSQQSKYPYDSKPPQMPSNVKLMTGTPWELYELPRQMYHNPEDVKYGAPPVRTRRAPKHKDTKLDTISERPHKASPLAQRHDASTSTTELDRLPQRESEDGSYEGSSPRKVQKGQINALAKMLSALRR
ncbi:kinase-like protein [Sparassis crispa]|uniref:Kinase-like protein n=1 Tax=Sparassis crispa TaxID=139825 RepID=A0A401GGX2_9APHY|nr:kinase-like protein [Sparassis crispa]GBE81412.1 kinase-like protein [Sparassis crispa]